MAKRAHPPGSLFNGMIAPLIPYAMKGAVWYQGEGLANSGRLQERYDVYLSTLIGDWRTRWKQDFPFAWVQLPEYRARQTEPGVDQGWAIIRESMLRALKIPRTGMAVTLGLGEAENLHPVNKKDVGKRLAYCVLGEFYQAKVPSSSGPLPTGHEIRGNEMVVRFSHADGGLVFANGRPEGFAICGSDGKWRWADARIEGNTVIVSHPEVKNPAAVRYAWANNPLFSLYNGAGLPASPFRTDDFSLKLTRPEATSEGEE
jgi:sialate O-acetylesterase